MRQECESDAAQVAGGWELNGSKMWITNGPEADVMVIYARSGPGPKNAHTAFVVDGARVGRGAKLDKLGMRGSNTSPLFLEKVFVPDAEVLGGVGQGARVLMSGLDLERLVLSAGPVGLAQAALDAALPYVHERKQFGAPIASQQLVQVGRCCCLCFAIACSNALFPRASWPTCIPSSPPSAPTCTRWAAPPTRGRSRWRCARTAPA